VIKLYIDGSEVGAYDTQDAYNLGDFTVPNNMQVGIYGGGFDVLKETTTYLATDKFSEKQILEEFWTLVRMNNNYEFVGFNVYGFDLPFLVKRSWANGITPPMALLRTNKGYWVHQFIDLRMLWQMGDRQAPGGLDVIGRFLTGKGKTGSGADFADLWVEDKDKALDYLAHDLQLTRAVHLAIT